MKDNGPRGPTVLPVRPDNRNRRQDRQTFVVWLSILTATALHPAEAVGWAMRTPHSLGLRVKREPYGVMYGTVAKLSYSSHKNAVLHFLLTVLVVVR